MHSLQSCRKALCCSLLLYTCPLNLRDSCSSGWAVGQLCLDRQLPSPEKNATEGLQSTEGLQQSRTYSKFARIVRRIGPCAFFSFSCVKNLAEIISI